MATLEELLEGVQALQNEVLKRGILFSGTDNPSIAGFAAPVKSLYSQMSGSVEISRWKKTGLNDTDWVEAPGEAGGGGGGAAITGAWDVTPIVVPQSSNPPNLVAARAATIDGNNLITTDLIGLPNEVAPKYMLAGFLSDIAVDFFNGPVKSYRIRLSMDGNFATDGQRLVFGFIDNSITTVLQVEAILNDRFNSINNSTAKYVFAAVGSNTGDTVMEGFADTGQTPNGGSSTLPSFTAGTNTLDIYFSLFNIGDIPPGGPDDYNIGIFVVSNDQPIAATIINSADLIIANPTLFKFFIGYAAYDDGLGGGVTNDVSFTVDYVNAPNSITPDKFGNVYPQPVIDTLIGAPVPAISVVIPEHIVQVTALPGGAAVDKLYRAVVNPAVTAVWGEQSVLPFGEYVRNGEIIRIAATTLGSEKIDVFNEWRNEGGIPDTLVSDVGMTNYVYPAPTNSSSQIEPNVTVITPNVEYRLTPSINAFNPYYVVSQSYLNHAYTLSGGTKRVEIKPSLKKDTIDTNNTVVSMNLYHGTVDPVSNGSNIVYVDPNNITATGITFHDHVGKVRIFGAEFQDDTVLTGIYYKIVTDTPITGVLGDLITWPYSSGTANGSIAYNDSGSNTVYIPIPAMNTLGTYLPVLGSWNTGFETVNITAVDVVGVLNKTATATVAAGNTAISQLSATFALYVTSAALEDIPTLPSEQLTQTDFDTLLMESATLATGVQLACILSVGSGFNEPTYTYNNGIPPIVYDTIQFWMIKSVDSNAVAMVTAAVYPHMVDGYGVKPDTFIAIDFDETDFKVRYINSNDQEVVVSVVNDIMPIGSNTNVVRSVNQITPNASVSITTGSYLPLEPSDVDVRLAWYPADTTRGIHGINATAPIHYVRDTDFTVDGTNHITVTGTIPSAAGYFQLVYDKTGTGLHYKQDTITETLTAAQMLAAANLNSNLFTIQQQTADIQLKLGSYERPDPLPITRFSVSKDIISPTVGELFTVDEDFNPTLNQPMLYQMRNALARVSVSGTYAGRYFTKGNYAMWDGEKTVPFPLLPAPAATLQPPADVVLTLTNVDNVTRFKRLHLAIQKIVDSGGHGTVFIDGTHDIRYNALYTSLNMATRYGIKIVGLNKTSGLPTDKLRFRMDGDIPAAISGVKSFFTNFKPFLENIRISTYTLGVADAYFAFKFADSAQTWVIGDNVVFEENEYYNGSGQYHGPVGFEIDTKIKFGKNLSLIRNDSSQYSRSMIVSGGGSHDIVVEGENINLTNTTYDPVRIDTGTLTFIDTRSTNPGHDFSLLQMIGAAQFGYKYAKLTFDGDRSGDDYVISYLYPKVNSIIGITQGSNGVSGVSIPGNTAFVPGDKIVILDSNGGFANFPLNVYPNGYTLQGYEGPIGKPYAEVVLTYHGNSVWVCEIVSGKSQNIYINTTPVTMTSAWDGNTVIFNLGTDITVTIPEDATEKLRKGMSCKFVRRGLGYVRFVKEGTDVLESFLGTAGVPRIADQYGTATYNKIDSGFHSLDGRLELEP